MTKAHKDEERTDQGTTNVSSGEDETWPTTGEASRTGLVKTNLNATHAPARQEAHKGMSKFMKDCGEDGEGIEDSPRYGELIKDDDDGELDGENP